jgi:hypothetical protein
MTLNEIAYNLLNITRGGKSHHHENISLEQIKFNIRYYRAMLIRRDYAKNGNITRHLEQDLGCLNLEIVNGSKCCGLEIDCEVAKTVLPIPKTVRFNFEDAITFVGGGDGLTRIPLISPQIAKFAQYEKYTSQNYKAYMIEDYLYVLNPKGLEFVNVRGVFENPEDVAKYECPSGICYDENSDYPIPMDMVEALTKGILSGELQMVSQTINDTQNNAVEDRGFTQASSQE